MSGVVVRVVFVTGDERIATQLLTPRPSNAGASSLAHGRCRWMGRTPGLGHCGRYSSLSVLNSSASRNTRLPSSRAIA